MELRCIRILDKTQERSNTERCDHGFLSLDYLQVPKTSAPSTFADSPDFVVSLARGLQIIKAFGTSGGDSIARSNMRVADAMTLSEVAEKTGLARAVVRRFLYTLAELGYVTTDGKYFRLTAKILDLGFAYLSSFSLPKLAERFLEEVTLETKESSSASVLDGHEIVCGSSSNASHYVGVTRDWQPVTRVLHFHGQSAVGALSTGIARAILQDHPV